MQFNESHPQFRGFSDYYARELLPKLAIKEARRKKAMRRFKVIMAVISVLAIWLFVTVVQRRPIIVALIPALMMLGIGGAVAYGLNFYKLSKDTKNHLVHGVCSFLGWTYVDKVESGPDLVPYIDQGLLTSRYDRVNFEDYMAGEAHGARFQAIECHMERESRDSDGDSSWSTVFHGSLMAMTFNERKFMGRTVVLRDKGMFNAKKKGDMKRVGLVDPVFEKIFEAYGTDQVEARYILTPDFMQQLVDLETSVDGRNIRFGFVDQTLYIAVETGDRFKAGSMFKPLSDVERTQKILDEVGAVYGVVDGIFKPGKPIA